MEKITRDRRLSKFIKRSKKNKYPWGDIGVRIPYFEITK